MPAPKDVQLLNRIRRNLLVDRIATGVPPSIAAREMGLDYKWVDNSCRDPEFKVGYDAAVDSCYQIMADRLTTLHEEIVDPKVAKNVGDNLKWWLSKRKPREFGDKVLIENDNQPQLLSILQAAVNRLIEAVPVPAQPIEGETIAAHGVGSQLIEARPAALDPVPVQRVAFRGGDPHDEHRP